MITKGIPIRSYYCSEKFKHIKIDLESKSILNCHASASHSVDFNWLSANPGELFNNPVSVSERHMMLRNERNASCEQNCWPAEDRGAISVRIKSNGVEKTHVQAITTPEVIDLTIGTNCNLTCSYCCKEYSSAWRRDIINHGEYINVGDSNRFSVSAKDRVLSKLSQTEIKRSKHYIMLLDEIKLAAPTLKQLIVTGGEPLLDNHLISVLADLPLPSTATVWVYTGLGVSQSRLVKIVGKLKNIQNLKLCVSAESTGKNLEFNRYGNKWVDIVKKIDILEDHNIDFQFHSSLSNLTLMGFVEFYNYFSTKCPIYVTYVTTPDMMAVHVLDYDTKNQIKNKLMTLPSLVSAPILKSMQTTPTTEQKTQLQNFLKQFIQRRPDLSLDIYPKSFVDWIGLDHVV